MDWQLAVVLACVVLSALFVMRSAWTTFTGGKSRCETGCGKCSTTTTAGSPEHVTGRISLPQVR